MAPWSAKFSTEKIKKFILGNFGRVFVQYLNWKSTGYSDYNWNCISVHISMLKSFSCDQHHFSWFHVFSRIGSSDWMRRVRISHVVNLACWQWVLCPDYPWYWPRASGLGRSSNLIGFRINRHVAVLETMWLKLLPEFLYDSELMSHNHLTLFSNLYFQFDASHMTWATWYGPLFQAFFFSFLNKLWYRIEMPLRFFV